MIDSVKISRLFEKLSFDWFAFLCLLILSLAAVFHEEWFVFDEWLAPLILVITLGFGSMLTSAIAERRTRWTIFKITAMVFVLLLVLVLLLVVAFIPTTKRCDLEGLTVAQCIGGYERFGNSVPEPPICRWRQTHIGGVFLIGEKYDKECYQEDGEFHPVDNQ